MGKSACTCSCPSAAETGSLPYTAAKAALNAYSKGLANEVGPHGIRVNIVSPGLIYTSTLKARIAAVAREQNAEPEAVLRSTVDAMNIPLQRAGTSQELAQLIVFLASPAASYLTGSQFTAAGGFLPTL